MCLINYIHERDHLLASNSKFILDLLCGKVGGAVAHGTEREEMKERMGERSVISSTVVC